MARRGGRDELKERFWRTMVRQWRRSGLSVRAFCAERRIAEPNFYAWRRTIAERDEQARRQRARHGVGQAVFVPVRVTDAAALAGAPALEVVLDRGRRVCVPVGFDAASLRQLLAVLEETPAC